MTETNNQSIINKDALEYVQLHIDYDIELMRLDGLNWNHVGFVEAEITDHKNRFYSDTNFYVEKEKYDIYYARHDNGNYHELIHSCTDCGDINQGFCLFPLTDGRYWKIEFHEWI